MIRLTQSVHASNDGRKPDYVSSDPRWFLDANLRLEVHPLRTGDQKKQYPKAQALVVVNGEAHFVDETPEQVMTLFKVVRRPDAYRFQADNGNLIAHDDLTWIGVDAEGGLEFGFTEIKA